MDKYVRKGRPFGVVISAPIAGAMAWVVGAAVVVGLAGLWLGASIGMSLGEGICFGILAAFVGDIVGAVVGVAAFVMSAAPLSNGNSRSNHGAGRWNSRGYCERHCDDI